MITIHYMWGMKPGEKNEHPLDVIRHNTRFIPKFNVFKPNENILKNLITNYNDELYHLFQMIPKWVTKADLLRLLLIYTRGGMYCDSDCFIQKNIVIDINVDTIVFIEKLLTNIQDLGYRERHKEHLLRIANYCFYSKPNTPFIKDVIDECILRLNKILIEQKNINWTQDDVLWVCGPDVITTVYHRTKGKYKILLLPRGFLNHKCVGSWRSSVPPNNMQNRKPMGIGMGMKLFF